MSKRNISDDLTSAELVSTPAPKKRKLNNESKDNTKKVASQDNTKVIITDIDETNFNFGVWNEFKRTWNSMHVKREDQIHAGTEIEKYCYNIFALAHLTLLRLLHSRFARRKDWSMPPWLAHQMITEHCVHLR